MKYRQVGPHSPLRKLFPTIQRLRYLAWKFHDRLGIRLLVSGGKVRFMDTELNFPEGVGLAYSTPLFWNGPDAYEAPTSQTLSRLASHSSVFFDIGSNVGIYAVYVGVKHPQMKIFAFEAVPAIWEKNRAFHRANRLPETNVQQLAMGDREGTQKLFLPVYTTGIEEEQTATLNADSWQTSEARVETFEIQTTSLDAFTAGIQLPAGTITLKIDVENHEAAVFRGGRKFIGERRPWIVCEILSNQDTSPGEGFRHNHNQEVLALVTELGYAPFAIMADGFFRMTPADFARPRTMKDFLLAPSEKIPPDTGYFNLAGLETFLAK